MSLERESRRRRTFAIISHPDAGKTTITEKLLLYSGAIHLAGSIKSRKAARHTVSDWMKLEQERGISVSSSVLQFEYRDKALNLLDTPGHADFSEDTYRTLAAVDSSIMLIDHAKGVEARTLKLFEVCRMRKLPIVTFMNKLDRDGLDPLQLIDEVSETLNLRVCPMNWPIGMGRSFKGVVDLETKMVSLYTPENMVPRYSAKSSKRSKNAGQFWEMTQSIKSRKNSNCSRLPVTPLPKKISSRQSQPCFGVRQ